jgi:hypothetical protein
LRLGYAGNVAYIDTIKEGTGGNRDLQLRCLNGVLTVTGNAYLVIGQSTTKAWYFDSSGMFRSAQTNSTTMTDGFIQIPGAAGVPTGVPANTSGGFPFYYDSTNNKIYVYNGSWRSTAALT